MKKTSKMNLRFKKTTISKKRVLLNLQILWKYIYLPERQYLSKKINSKLYKQRCTEIKKTLESTLKRKEKNLIEVIKRDIIPCTYQETGPIVYNEILILKEWIMKW